MAYADQVPGSRRITTIAGVAIIHGVIGYAFVTGMAVDFVRSINDTLTTTNIALPQPPPPDRPPPPQRTPSRQTAQTNTVPIDTFVPTRPADTSFPVDVDPVLPLPPLPPTLGDVSPPQPPASRAAGPQVKGGKGAWITNDDYPASAIRAEQEGVVGIAVRIDADGRVASCTVSASSGIAVLDEAACRLYQRRARFVPARDDAGAAIASSYNDRVRWQLPR